MLDALTDWGRTCGLHFNPEKSVAVVFSRRRKPLPLPLKIDGRPIEYKSTVKYLGITLDSKLHWTPHITEKITKAKRYLAQVAVMTRRNWGPKPKLMRWAYLGIVRPMLCYGAMIWGHRAPALEAKLRRVNRMAINTFASFPKSTPTAALEIMLDVMPLHIYLQQEGLATRTRLDDVVSLGWDGVNKNKTHSTSHLKFWAALSNKADIDPSGSDRCGAILRERSFRINRDSFDGKAKHRVLTQINAFTDGSRANEQTGAGFMIYSQNKQELHRAHYRLPDYATVFQAEVLAINKAADYLVNLHSMPLRHIKIFVDSRAAIQAIGNPSIKSKTVLAATAALEALAQQASSVTLCWINAHRGYFGNTQADDMAKRGGRSTNPRDRLPLSRPMASIKATIKDTAYKQWHQAWNASPIAQHSKQFYYSPNHCKAKYVYKLARLELGRFVRIITGHCNLNSFQTKIGLWNNSLCRFCKESEETSVHLVTVCPSFRQTRTDFFQDTPPTNDMAWSVRSLLDFSFVPPINAAFEGSWAHGDPLDVHDLDSLSTSSQLSDDSS